MERRRTMAPSVYARAAMMRRAASRKRTLDVNRTPYGVALEPTWDNARDALEVAWDATQDARPEHERKIKPLITRGTARPKVQGRDVFGPVFVKGPHKVYGVHYRTRLVGAERMRYVRTDAWAKERALSIGQAKVAEISAPSLYVRAENVDGLRNGGFPRIWTAPGERPRFRDYSPNMVKATGDDATDESLWAERWGILDGQAYRFRFNRETGEMRRA